MAGCPAVGPVPTPPSEEGGGSGPATRAAPTGQPVPGPSKGRGFVVELDPVATGVNVRLTGKILARGIGGGQIILVTPSSNAAKCHTFLGARILPNELCLSPEKRSLTGLAWLLVERRNSSGVASLDIASCS